MKRLAILEQALTELWSNFLVYTPRIAAAVVALIIGLILGKVIGRIVKNILEKIEISKYITRTEKLPINIPNLFSVISRWAIYLVFIQQAAVFLKVEAITLFVNNIIAFLPGLIEAAIIIIVGYIIGAYLKDQILASKTTYSDLVGKVIFFLVIYLSIAMGMKSVSGINTSLLDNVLLVILASAGIGIAIALGLGLKDVVKESAKEYLKKKR